MCFTLSSSLAGQTSPYLVPQVDLGEAESLQVNARSPDGRSHRLQENLLQVLTHEGPGLLQDLQAQGDQGHQLMYCVVIQQN